MRALAQYPHHRSWENDPFAKTWYFALKWNAVKDNVLFSRSIEGCMFVQTRAENAILFYFHLVSCHAVLLDTYRRILEIA